MTAEEKRKLKRQARAYLKEAVLLLPRLVQLLYRLMRDPRVSRTDKALVAAVLAYVASPFDLIPDMIPFVGQVDDLLAVSLVLLRLVDDCGEDVLREHWSGSQDLVPWIRGVARFARILLPQRVTRGVVDKFGAP